MKGLDDVFHTTWGHGYDLMPFVLDGKPHYLAYNPANGGVSVDRINAGGHDVTTVWSSTWTTGWTR